MEAYSLDLRQRICAACDQGDQTRQEVADGFRVGVWFVYKILRQRRQTGSIAPRPRGHGPEPLMDRGAARRVRELVRARSDATLAELCRALGEQGGPQISVPTMHRTLKALRLPLKKRRFTPASGTRTGSGRYAGTLRSASPGSSRGSWSSWTKAGSTPP
jgi:transposase